jgi:hypothetical protein
MDAQIVSQWMITELERAGCIYQDDVVDYLVKNKADYLLRENADGNLVVGLELLKFFKELTETTVVWVKSGFYWRWRVPEDEPGRDARG